ncbi:MAG: hypothetical protein ACOX1P_28780 [Thermoguttaceae bacterium]
MRNDWANRLLIRATLALAATSICIAGTSARADKNDVFRLTVAPATARNPRNSESDIIELRDGRLLLGWTEFYAGNGADAAGDVFAYPSVTVVGDRALLTYFNYQKGNSLFFQSIPAKWFYQ